MQNGLTNDEIDAMAQFIESCEDLGIIKPQIQ